MTARKQEVAVAEPTLPGFVPDAEIDAVVARFSVFNEGAKVVANRLPTQVERQVLQKQNAELNEVLRPASDSQREVVRLRTAVSVFLGGYASMAYADAGGLVAAYTTHLQTLPAWAVEAAIGAVVAGTVKVSDGRGGRADLDPDRPPSSVRLHRIAQDKMRGATDRRYRIDRILSARETARADEQVDENRRREMGHELRALADNMRIKDDRDDGAEARRAAAKARSQEASVRVMRDEYMNAGLEPPLDDHGNPAASLSMLRSLGWRVEEVGGRRVLVSPGKAPS